MKRFTFIATALIALASCSDSEFVGDQNTDVGQNEQGAIIFGSGTSNITRASFNNEESADLLGKNFVVKGIKSDGTIDGTEEKDVFDHYNVNWVTNTANTTTSNTANWEYVGQAKHAYGPLAETQTIKYWDYAKSQYDFIAFSAGKDNTAVYASGSYSAGTNVYITEITPTSMTSSTVGAYTIKGKAAQLAKVYIADLQTIYRDKDAANDAKGDYNKTVTLTFRPLSAKVRVALYETVPGYSIKDVVFYTDASTVATDGNAHLYTTDTDVFNEEGTYTVYYPTTGSANTGNTDYNKAHLSFVPETSTGTATVKEFGALDLTNTGADKEVAEATETPKPYLGRASNTATYAGDNAKNHYTIVLPNETGAVLNLKVDYTLVSTDGSGEVINVKKASAQVPKQFATWKSGYAYTYLFKISETNGWTNPSAGPAGLYPVTFDAVVVNDELDNTQETITTVATPSITTYAKGTVVTTYDEYLTGNNIYVVVGNGTALTVGTNANLYTVTLEDGAAQTINEASVANAIKNGGAASPFVVTDANDKKMTVTAASGLTAITEIAAADAPDGNAITVNGAKFTPAAPTFEPTTPTPTADPHTEGLYERSGSGTSDDPYVYTVTSDATVNASKTYYTKSATTSGIYVFEYISGTDKYYKIIKLVDKY